MVNKVTLIGRLGRDPEMRYSQSGMAIANFSMATSEIWNDKNGQKQERTEWHRIVAFDRLGEICGQYLAKGKLIYIDGRIQTREWTDKENVKRYTTEIIALNMKMLEPKGSSTGQKIYEEDPGPSDSDLGPPAPPASGTDFSNDIPF